MRRPGHRICGRSVGAGADLTRDVLKHDLRDLLAGLDQSAWKAECCKLQCEPELVVVTPASTNDHKVLLAQSVVDQHVRQRAGQAKNRSALARRQDTSSGHEGVFHKGIAQQAASAIGL